MLETIAVLTVLPYSDGARTQLTPAFRIDITFHSLGDFCPVIDLGLINLYRSRVKIRTLFQNIRALAGLVLLMFALSLSFNGFPGAMLSWFGGGIVMTGYIGSIATITHENTGEDKLTAGMRILVMSIGYAIASFGSAMIDCGGLTSVTLSDTFTVPFRETGILFGIAGGLYNVDGQNSLSQPSQKSGKISQYHEWRAITRKHEIDIRQINHKISNRTIERKSLVQTLKKAKADYEPFLVDIWLCFY